MHIYVDPPCLDSGRHYLMPNEEQHKLLREWLSDLSGRVPAPVLTIQIKECSMAIESHKELLQAFFEWTPRWSRQFHWTMFRRFLSETGLIVTTDDMLLGMIRQMVSQGYLTDAGTGWFILTKQVIEETRVRKRTSFRYVYRDHDFSK